MRTHYGFRLGARYTYIWGDAPKRLCVGFTKENLPILQVSPFKVIVVKRPHSWYIEGYFDPKSVNFYGRKSA